MPEEAHDLEKAQAMFKLARKNNWGHRYDRLEHFKRFEHLSMIVKELSVIGWVFLYKKSQYTGIALNTQYKKEIIAFIEQHMPHVRGVVE